MPNADFNANDCLNSKPTNGGLALTGNILVICAGVLLVAAYIISVFRARKTA